MGTHYSQSYDSHIKVPDESNNLKWVGLNRQYGGIGLLLEKRFDISILTNTQNIKTKNSNNFIVAIKKVLIYIFQVG